MFPGQRSHDKLPLGRKGLFLQGVEGDLPCDKKVMLKTLRKALDFIESTELEVKDSNQLLKEGFITAL